MTRPDAQARLGSLLLAGSAVAYSTAGLFTRVIQADAWTILFWRGLFGALAIGCYLVWRHRGQTPAAFRAIGWPGLAAAACSTVATICYVHALRLTTVADVSIAYATAPLIAAAIGWAWLRRSVSRITLGASALAVVGVAIMVGPAAATGHLTGDLLALAMTALFAVMMTIMRRHAEVPMAAAACLSAFACALIVAPVARPASVGAVELGWLALFGITQFGLGLLLVTLGSRLISAAQAALVGNLGMPLAPLWVWLAFGEWPSLATWVGGGIVMAGVLLDIGAGWTASPRQTTC
jgi:drug/metabolite transporter (DMT)-like permease